MLTGKDIAKLRKFKGFHQKEIASNLNVCQQYISKLEKRETLLDRETTIKILEALKISSDEWDKIKYLFISRYNN